MTEDTRTVATARPIIGVLAALAFVVFICAFVAALGIFFWPYLYLAALLAVAGLIFTFVRGTHCKSGKCPYCHSRIIIWRRVFKCPKCKNHGIVHRGFFERIV